MPGAKLLLQVFLFLPLNFGVPYMQTICKKWQQALVCLVVIFCFQPLNAHEGFSDYLDLEHCQWYQNPQFFYQRHLAQFRKPLGESEFPPSDEDQFTDSLYCYYSSFFQNRSSFIRTDIPAGLTKDKRIYPTVLDREEKNFVKSSILRINKILPNDLWLVNLRALRQDPQRRIYDQEFPGASLRYFSTLNTALAYKTIGDYCESNAILDYWSAYCNGAIVHIPKGASIVAIAGLAVPQIADLTIVNRDAHSLGIDPLIFQQSVQGGGVQLFLAETSQATVYDLGSLFKSTGERFISRLGDPKKLQPYLNPAQHFPLEAKLRNLHCHLLYKGWRQQPLNLRNFLGLVRRFR
jgi:hypothetical protein